MSQKKYLLKKDGRTFTETEKGLKIRMNNNKLSEGVEVLGEIDESGELVGEGNDALSHLRKSTDHSLEDGLGELKKSLDKTTTHNLEHNDGKESEKNESDQSEESSEPASSQEELNSDTKKEEGTDTAEQPESGKNKGKGFFGKGKR